MSRSKRHPQGTGVGIRTLSNVIGDRGERIFELAITDYEQFRYPLFKPAFLGEKWPNIDYYVELLGVRNASPFFLAQVKSTAGDIAGESLSIQAPKVKCVNPYRIPGPTYLVGVHEPTSRAFIMSLHTTPQHGVYNIPLRFELHPDNLQLLHQEVADFWRGHPSKPGGSHFI
jgi:hypothetical protein